jgi:hypothetical protein
MGATTALFCVLVCLIHPRRGRLSRVIGNSSHNGGHAIVILASLSPRRRETVIVNIIAMHRTHVIHSERIIT